MPFSLKVAIALSFPAPVSRASRLAFETVPSLEASRKAFVDPLESSAKAWLDPSVDVALKGLVDPMLEGTTLQSVLRPMSAADAFARRDVVSSGTGFERDELASASDRDWPVEGSRWRAAWDAMSPVERLAFVSAVWVAGTILIYAGRIAADAELSFNPLAALFDSANGVLMSIVAWLLMEVWQQRQ